MILSEYAEKKCAGMASSAVLIGRCRVGLNWLCWLLVELQVVAVGSGSWSVFARLKQD